MSNIRGTSFSGGLQTRGNEATKTVQQLKKGLLKIKGDKRSLAKFCKENGIEGDAQNFLVALGSKRNTQTTDPGKRIEIALQLRNKIDQTNIDEIVKTLTNATPNELTTADTLLANINSKSSETNTPTAIADTSKTAQQATTECPVGKRYFQTCNCWSHTIPGLRRLTI